MFTRLLKKIGSMLAKPKTETNDGKGDVYEPSHFKPCELADSQEPAATTINITEYKLGRIKNA